MQKKEGLHIRTKYVNMYTLNCYKSISDLDNQLLLIFSKNREKPTALLKKLDYVFPKC